MHIFVCTQNLVCQHHANWHTIYSVLCTPFFGVPNTLKLVCYMHTIFGMIYYYAYSAHSFVSLSTVVLNSRDWYEIVWLPEISHFKINLAIGFIQKTGWNALVSGMFRPTANFEIFEIHLYFVCLPACLQ